VCSRGDLSPWLASGIGGRGEEESGSSLLHLHLFKKAGGAAICCLKYKPNSAGSNPREARCQWLMPVIIATQGTEIRRIMVQSQPGQIVQ
jgi:hypothetical protein